MRFLKPLSRPIVIAYGLVLGMVAVLGVAPSTLVAAEVPAQHKNEQKAKSGWGKFMGFKDGKLTLKANDGALIENQIPENTRTVVWDHDKGVHKPAVAAEALTQAKLGTWCLVSVHKGSITLEIGARKGQFVGTFVSFKNDRLLILGKDLPESFTRKYGDSVHFNKFAEAIPVHESIDGGKYKLAGTPSTVLRNVKEGTLITVHSEGEENFTLIQIGAAKKK